MLPGFFIDKFTKQKMNYEDCLVSSLGKRGVISPLKHSRHVENPVYKFVGESERILHDVSLGHFKKCIETGELPVSFEKAGPREIIGVGPAAFLGGAAAARRHRFSLPL